MPLMDGWTFARRYRQLPSASAPIVVMTAAQDSEEPARRIGAHGYLAKPFLVDELLTPVRHHLPA